MTQDKPTIEDVLKKYETYVKHSDIPIYLEDNVKAAMTEWASLNRQGCRWVKASERLPEQTWDGVVRWEDKEVRRASMTEFGFCSYKYGKYGNVYSEQPIEWLDESIEPCATSSENYKVMKYRKKPVVIDAVHLTEDLFWKIQDKQEPPVFGQFTFSGSWHPINRTISSAYIYIKTLEGDMRANIGDWIIKGVNGEFYPCKPDIFEKTYQSADETPSPTDRDCEELKKEVESWENSAIIWEAKFNGSQARISELESLLEIERNHKSEHPF